MPLKKHILFFKLCLVFFSSSIKAGDGHPDPVADFLATNLCYGSLTVFNNTSTSLQNPGYKWTIWQQGNSVPIYTSTATNIIFQFPAKTTYTVLLDVMNYVTATHIHYGSVQRVIYIDSIPIANFDYKDCHTQFSNMSCCANSYLWDFGDGTPTSTLMNPTHTYTAFINYTVTLIASNGSQSDTLIKVAAPYANTLSGNFNITYTPDSIRFKSLDDSTKGTFCDWEWDFGDGSTLDIYGTPGWKPVHHYVPLERDSVYKVSLLVKDACFSANSEKYVLIKGIGKNVTSTYVYPSPVVYGYLNIESNEKDKLQEIKIIDCLGKRLDNLTVWDKPYGYYLWIGHIANGVYTVQLIFPDRIENHKIIKE